MSPAVGATVARRPASASSGTVHVRVRHGAVVSMAVPAAGRGGGSSLGAARRQVRQTVDFSLKGPVHVTLDEMPAGPPGCSVVDLLFNTPSQVSELVFHNYYTAWLTVLVRMLVTTTGPACPAPGPGTEHGVHGSHLVASPHVQHAADQVDVAGAVVASQGDASGKPRKESGWVVAVARRVLMPSPHLEAGSHDFVSILATESAVPWNELMAMRLVLRQPSPSWHTFHVEEIHVFAEPPRRALWSRRGQPLNQLGPLGPLASPLQSLQPTNTSTSAASPAQAVSPAVADQNVSRNATRQARLPPRFKVACSQVYDSILVLLRHQTQAALRSSVPAGPAIAKTPATPTRARQSPAYEINSLPPV